jgi:hypothetical protein
VARGREVARMEVALMEAALKEAWYVVLRGMGSAIDHEPCFIRRPGRLGVIMDTHRRSTSSNHQLRRGCRGGFQPVRACVEDAET